MGWVLMSEREVHRVEVLSRVVAGGMSTSEGSRQSSQCMGELLWLGKFRHNMDLPVRFGERLPHFAGLSLESDKDQAAVR